MNKYAYACLVSLPARWYNLARSATLAQWQSNRFVSDRLSVQLRWVAHPMAPFAGLFCDGLTLAEGCQRYV